jgi:hypothetical protein
MAAMQVRLEENHLTTPHSYSIRFVPRGSAGIDELAADIALRHPNFSKADILTILRAEDEAIMARLLDGEQVTKEGSFSWFPSFTGRLDDPDEPLPPPEDCLHVSVRISPPYLAAFRQAAEVERLQMEKKAPLISSARDSLLGLKNVLNPDGALQLLGDDLFFDRSVPGAGQCVLAGTAGGSIVQTRLLKVEPSEIMLMPEIPAQAHPWNNECTVSVSTRYTEHGSLRTSTYDRMLRTPLTLTNMGHPNPPETGILTGSSATAHVSVTGGSVSADTMLRVQVIQDLPNNRLRFSLLDMTEGGQVADEVPVTQNGGFTLPGFSGSPVSTLEITVNDYAALWDMIRNNYSGRVVDVLKVETGA